MRAVAVLFTAGPSEFAIEPGSEKAHNEYLFQGEEGKGDLGMSQGGMQRELGQSWEVWGGRDQVKATLG